jgi:hypothetical protein
VSGDTILLLMNGGTRAAHFVLPKVEGLGAWETLVDTARGEAEGRPVRGDGVSLAPHSLILIRHSAS